MTDHPFVARRALPVLALLLVLGSPAPAPAHHKDGHHGGPPGERFMPEVEAPDVDVDLEAPGAAADWWADLETEATAPATKRRSTTRRARTTRRRARSAARGLRGVPYRALILRHARANGLDPAMVAAVVHAESGFNRRAVSRVGARGLMQLMPATARGMGARVSRLFEPAVNIAYGTRYLAYVRRAVGRSTRLMAAAYNAGPGAVRRFRGVPPYAETRAYVRRVVALTSAYRRR